MSDPQNASDRSAPEKGPGCPSAGRTAVAGPGLATTLRSPVSAPVGRRIPMPSPDDQGRAFDGCHRECWKAGTHTLTWGLCEHAVEPEPTVSMSAVYTDPADGQRSIALDRFTAAELAELIEPALCEVGIRLGSNALALLRDGHEVRLSGGAITRLALAAADAIVTHSNRDAT